MPPRLPASPFSSLRWSVTIQRYILAEILVSSIAIYIYVCVYTTQRIRWILETSRVNIRASTHYLYYLCDHVSTVSPALTHSALDVRICIIRVTCFMEYYDRLRFSLSLSAFGNIIICWGRKFREKCIVGVEIFLELFRSVRKWEILTRKLKIV